jgi:cytochrome d ubiquinol oxidase subunit II
MWIPLTLAALGIIFRGSGFAFRKWADTVGRQRFYGAAFAGASVLTPFFLGTVAGGVASGRVPLGNSEGHHLASWLNPTSLLGGTLAVVATAYLAAVLICREAELDRDEDMASYFRQRALASGVTAGAIAAAGVFVLASDARALFEGLTSPRGSLLLFLSGAAGLGSLLLVYRRRYLLARPLAALATVSVLWGWGAGQYPWVLEGQVTIEDAAASEPVLRALLIAFVAAALLAVPSLLWLFRLTQARRLGEGEIHPDSTEALMQ